MPMVTHIHKNTLATPESTSQPSTRLQAAATDMPIASTRRLSMRRPSQAAKNWPIM